MSKKSKDQNALKHGVYAKTLILPGEKAGDYELLVKELYEEWAPEGVTERNLVDRLVLLYWRKERLERYEHLSLQQRVSQIETQSEINRHRKNLHNLADEFGAATNEEAVAKIFTLLSPWYVDIITSKVPRESCKDSSEWGPLIAKSLSRFDCDESLEGTGKLTAILNPELMEAELERSNRLDEAIDRTIKRLMQVKTAKQVFPTMRKAEQQILIAATPTPRVDDSGQNSSMPSTVEIPAKRDPNESPVPLVHGKAVLHLS
jgi:hypothetical protein